jgi:uncharacterized protein (DUF1501 family)
MLVPIDRYEQLRTVRENIIIPENKLLPFTDTIGLHPALSGIKSLYEEAQLSIVQSVGYPNQNRSHFRSKDIWMTASDADEFISTGWLGRYFDTQLSDYPNAYPNESHPDPIAITIGSLVSETCQGIGANFSLALRDVESLAPLSEGAGSDLPDNYYGKELGFLRNAIAQTNAYGETILNAANKGKNQSNLYPDAGNNPLADQLKVVANLISGGLKTKVYVVSLGGFDTHANQVESTDVTTGEHATLLNHLSTAMLAFQDDLQQLGVSKKVVGMTFSEFGRRIKSNGSLGTDHGTAAPLMVFGNCVNANIFGENPEIPEEVGNQDGVQMQYDFRSVYASLLMDWFEADEAAIRNHLFADFQYIPIIKGCDQTTSIKPTPIIGQEKDFILSNSPNPFAHQTTIEFESTGEWIKLSLFDAKGAEIKVLANQQFAKGIHRIEFNGSQLPKGNYYYRLQTNRRQKVKLMVKM